MESPDADLEMACPMVLQGARDAKHGLLSLPVNPFTYQVVLARAAEAWVRSSAVGNRLVRMRFMTFSVVKYACKTNLTNLGRAAISARFRTFDCGALARNDTESSARSGQILHHLLALMTQ